MSVIEAWLKGLLSRLGLKSWLKELFVDESWLEELLVKWAFALPQRFAQQSLRYYLFFKKIIIEKFARFRFYEYLCTRKIGNLATYGV